MPVKNDERGFYNAVTLGVERVTDDVVKPYGDIPYHIGYVWRQRFWNTIPGWKARLASQGYLETQGYQDVQYMVPRISAPGYMCRFRLKTNPKTGWNVKTDHVLQPNPGVIGTPSHNADAATDACNKALNKARQMRVNLAVATAEGRKTFRMLKDTIQTLGRSYKAFRKGQFKKAARILGINTPRKSVSNNWLAYQYGWKPLVSDAVGLIELHRDKMSSLQKERYIIRASKTLVKTSVVPVNNWAFVGNHALKYVTDVTTSRAGFILEVNSSLDRFRAEVGLAIPDILLTAWELVPFSFVFDWFVDVGTWMQNQGALSGLTVLDAWLCQETKRSVNFLASGGPGSLYASNLPSTLGHIRVFHRSSWNPGTLTWPRTRGLGDLTLSRAISAAALLSQQFRGDPPIGKFRPRGKWEGRLPDNI